MNLELEKLHKISLYVVVLVAFLCIVAGGGAGPIIGSIFVAGMVTSWWIDEKNLLSPAAGKWFNGIILAFIGLTIFQVIMTEEPIIDAAVRFVLLLVVIKLLGRFEPRDDLQIYALSLLIFAAATAVNQGVTYGILFGIYVLAGTLSLALFHLTVESRENRKGLTSHKTPFNRQYVAVLSVLSLAIFASSMVIFLTFPRVGLGFFVRQQRQGVNVTGFDESVELGSHGVIRDNPQVVMRIEFPEGKPENYNGFHWRTMALDRYDGRSWTQSNPDQESPLNTRDGSYWLGNTVPDPMQSSSRDLPETLQIYLEPIGTNLLPRLWPTEKIALGSAENPIRFGPDSGSVTVDYYGDTRHTIENDLGIPYRLTTSKRPDRQQLRERTEGGRTPDDIRERYLQLPEVSDRFTQLASEITEDESTPYRKAEAVSTYLQSNYTYTTDLPEIGQNAPVEAFLFDTRRGHCEYFATAGVLMLRSAGVPARIVNGFLGGTWNEVGGYLGVRQGDAHSWIELWVPGFGWAPLDPTPAADVLPDRANPLVQWYRDTYDAMRLNWMKWVIEYDLASQIELFKKAGKYMMPRGLMQNGDDRETSGGSDQQLPTRQVIFWLGLLGIGVGSFLSTRRTILRRGRVITVIVGASWPVVSGIWVTWFQGFEWHYGVMGGLVGLAGAIAGGVGALGASSAPEARLRRVFERIEKAAAASGHGRREDEGPGSYLSRLARAYPDVERELMLFRRHYLRARFSGV
ncbi:MAG: transglutaminase TgpA family protein, partial [Myxococcota bacterium]